MYQLLIGGKRLNVLITLFLVGCGLIILFPLLFPYIEQVISIIDELLVLAFVALLLFHVYKGRIPIPVLVISGSIIFLFLISIPSPFYRGGVISVIQLFTHLKFFVVFFLVVSFTKENYKMSFFHITAILSLLGVAVGLLLPDYFEFTDGEKYRFLEGIPRVVGFQSKPNNLAYSAILLQIIYGFTILNSDQSYKHLRYTLLTITTIVIVVLAGSRASLIFYPIIFFFSLKDYFQFTIKNITVLLVLACLLSIVFISLSDSFIAVTAKNLEAMGAQGTVEFYNPRSLLYFYGFSLFIDFFPIGTGVATFGSTYSIGSQVYEMLGIDQMEFVVTTTGLFDSNLACIAGEFGLLGLILFAAIIVYFYIWGLRKYTNKYDKRRFTVTYIFLIFLATKGNVFMNGIYALMFSFAFTLPSLVIENNHELPKS